MEKNLALVQKFDQWLEIQQYAHNTRLKYGFTLREFCHYLGDRDVLKLEADGVRGFIRARFEKGVSSATLELDLHCLRNFFKFLDKGGIVSLVWPRSLAKMRKRSRKLPTPLTVEEVKRLIEATETKRNRALVELFYATGCRKNEILMMRCDDVNFKERWVRVLGKGNKERIVPYGRFAEEALLAYLGERRDGFVFQQDNPRRTFSPTLLQARPNKNEPTLWWRAIWTEYPNGTVPGNSCHKWLGNADKMTHTEALEKLSEVIAGKNLNPPFSDVPLDTMTIYRVIREAGVRAGLGNVHPHQLRHSAATHMLNNGADIRSIQEILGHSSISTTQIYTHVSTAEMQKTHAKAHPRG